MFSRIFINRPRLAAVVSIVITIAGGIALFNIPVAQYPQITPPEIMVSAAYPGASAQVLADTVAAPIEKEINGVDNMLYMSSSCSNSGVYTLSVTFEVGTDPDIDQVNLQNRVQLATPKLPQEVVAQGITVRKRSSDIMAAISFYSPNKSRDMLFLSNYVSNNVKDALVRIKGVSDVFIFGEKEYSVRIWINPDQLTAKGLTADDVILAIRQQNIQAAVGGVGGEPVDDNQQVQYTLLAKGRLSDIEDFKNIIVSANSQGGVVRVRDIAEVELAAKSYAQESTLNGAPAATIGVYRSSSANAMNTMKAIRAELKHLAKSMPGDMKYQIILDTTGYVQAAIDEIIMTLLLTSFLVILVVFIFLQDWRATLIPAVTIPVSLIGTFSVLLALGYSANTISLFALIMAIGVVVDDANVVVENVVRVMHDEKLPAKEAAIRAMGQVTGPIIATTLVLFAVFVPVGFMPGITGQLYKQFAVTMCTSVFISAICALTLSPAMCATVLRPPKTIRRGPLAWFNRSLDASRKGYVASSAWLIRRLAVALLALVIIIGGAYFLFSTRPTSFLPDEDQGYFFMNVQLPEAASLARTSKTMQQITSDIKGIKGVSDVIGVSGFSLLSGNADNVGFAIAILTPWDERKHPGLKLGAIVGRAQGKLASISTANSFAFTPPAIMGMGASGGFDFRLKAMEGQSPQGLASVTLAMMIAANQDPTLMRVFSTYTANTPQVFLDIDRTRAEYLKIPIARIFSTLQAQLGSSYVNDFNLNGHTYQVKVQSQAPYRDAVSDINRLYVRSNDGKMVPMTNLATTSTVLGPQVVNRYNQFLSAQINGGASPGFSSGEAMAAMDRIAASTLPPGYSFEWSSMSLQEQKAGGQIAVLFALALIFAYLFMAGQYESWSIPLSIILSIPVATLGALAGLWLFGLPLSIYAQIGLVLLVGLAAKNAILIVEFAQERRKDGLPIAAAAVDGASIRYRPVLMTAFTFILGVFPMVIATGAGAGSRRAVGVTVFSGMLAGTVIGIFLIPALYYIFQSASEKGRARRRRRRGGVSMPLLLSIILATFLTGCAMVGPDYTRVEPATPKTWHTKLQDGLTAEKIDQKAIAQWWNLLNDLKLETLVERAVSGNLDMKNAKAKVREARALWSMDRAAFFPTLNGNASATKTRGSEKSGSGRESELYAAGFDAGWEIDLFGGKRRGVEAAKANLEASEEDTRDVLVSLVAEVVLNYIEVRTYQAQLAVSAATIKSQEKSYELNLSRYQAGIIDEIAVQQSLYSLEHTRSSVPGLETGLAAAQNRLSVLLGEMPGSIEKELADTLPIPAPPLTVAIGVPAEAMRRRPDIRRAERNLAAATARIGVATADLYPKLRLTGTIGLESTKSSELMEWASHTWRIGPGITWNIFDGGAIRQNIEVQNARQEQALIQYEAAVLNAQEEVENAIVSYAKEQRRKESLCSAMNAAQRTCELANDQYQAGLVDFSNVLDAQRALQSFENELAVSKGTIASNLVRLYKALGGGWETWGRP
ncbi:MAG: multidrug efflux RND transporter permease subunit [Pseudomonadota bacterium]